MLFRSPSPVFPSSKIGSDTTYFSLAQLPRSCIRQRSQQNGKSLCIFESVSALQIGHLCFMVCLPAVSREARNLASVFPKRNRFPAWLPFLLFSSNCSLKLTRAPAGALR